MVHVGSNKRSIRVDRHVFFTVIFDCNGFDDGKAVVAYFFFPQIVFLCALQMYEIGKTIEAFHKNPFQHLFSFLFSNAFLKKVNDILHEIIFC